MMAKRKKSVSKKTVASSSCSSCCCSGKDWIWAAVSEAALYFFFVYAQYLVGVQTNIWLSSLVLLILINLCWFACPVMRKHFCH